MKNDGKKCKYKIGIHSEHVRSIGRRFCEGLAKFLQAHPNWDPVFFEQESVRPADLAGIDGFIWAVPDEAVARILVATGKPVVDNGSDGIYPGTVGAGSDLSACGEVAAEHFLSRRFNHFAFCGWRGLRFSDVRGESFGNALAARGYACPIYVRSGLTMRRYVRDNILTERFELPSDAAALLKWLKRLPKPIGIFCANDLRAWQLGEICAMAKVRVPEEVAILGADNDTVACTLARVQLSSVDTDGDGLGRIAAETLASILVGRRRRNDFSPITLKPKGAVARASTAVYPVDPPWLADALAHIHLDVGRALTAEDVARHVGKSYGTVENAFKDRLKTTVQREIMSARIEAAERLLQTTRLPMATVAAESGFGSAQYFSRCFAACSGMSPARWREQFRY